MKNIIFAFVLVSSITSFGQDSTCVFSEVFQTSISKDDNYTNILLWIAESLDDANEVMQKLLETKCANESLNLG